MKIKKIAFLLATVILISLIQIPSIAQNDFALITFGENGEQTRMFTDIIANETTRDGRNAIILDPDGKSVDMNIKMATDFSTLTDGTCIKLYVTYYDEGLGKFTLYYDGVNGQTEHPDVVRLKNTCTWKTKVYEFQNPKFNKSIAGADIKISLKTPAMDKSTGKVIISEIRAEKTEYKSVYNVEISTDNRAGNIYFSDEELTMGIKIKKNDSIPIYADNCDVTYEIRDYDNKLVWTQKKENINLKQGYNEKIVPENIKYGIYHLYVTAENKEHNYKSVYSTYFSYAVSARKNPKFGAKTHYGHQYPDPEKAIYLLEKSGIGHTNGGWGWSGIEQTKGTYSYGTGPVSRFQNLLAESEVDMINGFTYGNMLYTNAPSHTYMPVTDEAREAYANAAVWALKEHKSEYIEVWNEPDMSNFNPGHATWAEYAELLKTTYKKVKEFDQNIKVIGGSIVSIPLLPEARARGIIEAGGGDYMDAFSIHPYIWETSPLNDNFPVKLPTAGKILSDLGYPDMEIWITELGWASGPGQKFTYEQQASYLVQCYLMSIAYENFGNFMWYDFQDDGILETDKEDMFGLIKHWNSLEPWAAKKSFIAACYMNELMSGAEFVDSSVDGKRGHMYHYTNDGKDIYAVFSSEKTYLSGIASNQNEVMISDMFGNEDTISAVDGVLNILGGEEVIYIIGEDLKLEFAEPTVNLSSLKLGCLYGEGSTLEINSPVDITYDYSVLNNNITTEKNENTIKISFDEFTNDEEKLYITIKNEDKKILDGYIILNCVQPITVSITNDLFNIKNFNRWRGYLTITNHSVDKKSSPGKMTFTSPDLFAKKLPPIAVPELLPGQTKTIKFHFPEILRKEAYDLNAIISLDNGYVTQISDRIDFAVAPYASQKPVIDGIINENEWIMGAALDFSRKEQAVNTSGFTWNGKEDLSGRVCFEYDEDNLYLGAVVQDDVFYQENCDSTIWKGDSIQFAVGYSRANGNTGSAAFTEVGIALTPENEKVNVYQTEDVSLGRGLLDLEALDIECKIKREGTTTTYELKMPWKTLVPGGSVFEGGKSVAFSMLVNDNDGLGRKGWLEYASGIGLTKNINLFTFLKLMDK